MSATESTEPMTKDEYVARGGVRCPHCRSWDIEGGVVEIESGTASQEVWCSSCGRAWCDTYELTGYEDIE